jgi:ribulose kinase
MAVPAAAQRVRHQHDHPSRAAADWIVWQLCGRHVRNACTAG